MVTFTHRTRLGREVFETAAEAVLSWRMHEAAGVVVRASAPRAAAGVAVTCGLGVGPARLWAPCEVRWAVREPERAGFGYATGPGHPLYGEEEFVVSRGLDGEVWLTVRAVSRPVRWYARAAGPLLPLLQRGYAWRLGRALRRLSGQGEVSPPR
jgi:uncharacterized protein (UPF0548 family)